MTMAASLIPHHEFGAPWTIDDLKDLPDDDGNRYEIYDGSLLVTPHAGKFHGNATNRLHGLMARQVPKELLVGQSVGVSRKRTSYFIPDLFVVSEAACAEDGDAFHPTDVLVVVEVLSPSNARQDLILKRDEYALAGIPLYWIVDPRQQTLTVLELAIDGMYREAQVVRPGEVWRTDKPFPLAFDLAEIF
ncbi:Uma2 family endonuclease [Phytohabitans kaempferiae]|uniref:Uma2 family endonuclease n=1 Tax=Phytohabitans kaempferiae TaxID=1620943 RepID=A0ABV6MEN6_9ACTN